MSPHGSARNKQRGVAVIMALLLTTLAITLVASLFWQQQVQVREIENQRMQLQKQWILRGSLDWASLILREDAKHSSIDSLDEPWAVPLAETRLDQYVENGQADSDVADTTLSGSISDAQGRFNLSNLYQNGKIDSASVAIFSRLLTLLNLDPALAQNTANLLALTPQLGVPPPSASAVASAASTGGNSPSAGYTQIDDLLAVGGITPANLDTLKPYVIFLPRSTPVNVNTASAQVIAAQLGMSLDNANALVASRRSASFRDLADVSNRLPNNSYNSSNLSVSTNYFLIDGKVHMNRARLDMQALLERNGATTQLLWVREH